MKPCSAAVGIRHDLILYLNSWVTGILESSAVLPDQDYHWNLKSELFGFVSTYIAISTYTLQYKKYDVYYLEDGTPAYDQHAARRALAGACASHLCSRFNDAHTSNGDNHTSSTNRTCSNSVSTIATAPHFVQEQQ
jgi:hypothetical protein